MGGHIDPDTLVDGDAVFTMAMALNQAMHNNAAARKAYFATWGVEWRPLPTVGGHDFFPMPNYLSESTVAVTVR